MDSIRSIKQVGARQRIRSRPRHVHHLCKAVGLALGKRKSMQHDIWERDPAL